MPNFTVSEDIDQFMQSADFAAMRSLLSVLGVVSTARTYYVRSSGSDTNDGLTTGTAFLTPQKAVDVAASLYLAADVTIDGGGQSYSSGVALRATTGPGRITLSGFNFSTSTSCVASTGSIPSAYLLQNCTFASTSGGAIIANAAGLSVELGSGCTFGNCPNGSHMLASGNSQILTSAPYSITGGAAIHCACYDGGFIRLGSGSGEDNALSGTPNFSAGFAIAQRAGRILAVNQSYSGSGATGVRHNAATGGQIVVTPFAAEYFPGSAPGGADGATYGLYAAA